MRWAPLERTNKRGREETSSINVERRSIRVSAVEVLTLEDPTVNKFREDVNTI